MQGRTRQTETGGTTIEAARSSNDRINNSSSSNSSNNSIGNNGSRSSSNSRNTSSNGISLAAMGVVVAVGVQDRRNGMPEEGVTVAGESESGTGAVVDQQFGGGEEACLHTPSLPAGMVTQCICLTFLAQSVTRCQYTAPTLASGVKTVTSWATCTSIARGDSTQNIHCLPESHHRTRAIPSPVAVFPIISQSTGHSHGSTRTARRTLPLPPPLTLPMVMLCLRTRYAPPPTRPLKPDTMTTTTTRSKPIHTTRSCMTRRRIRITPSHRFHWTTSTRRRRRRR